MSSPMNSVRTSPRELSSSRSIAAPAREVFEAWTNSRRFATWWVPKSMSMSLLSCEMDVRVGGSYRLRFDVGGQTADFFGTYREVLPPSRLVWTNDEGGLDHQTVTTVTLVEADGKTLVTVTDRYSSEAALEDALSTGQSGAMAEQLEQLELLLGGTTR